MQIKTDPQWREQEVEDYLAIYHHASAKKDIVKKIFRIEKDRLIRDYLKLRIRLSRSPVTPSRYSEISSRRKAVEYAHAYKSGARNPEPSMIRAMAIAGNTPERIAGEFGTDSINISVFLKLFFDIIPLLPFRPLLQGIVSRAQTRLFGADVAPEEAASTQSEVSPTAQQQQLISSVLLI